MSSNIWTRCAGASELRPLRLAPWRMVEAQHRVSTLKLVDTLEEQVLLEELVEGVKPPRVREAMGLHYLLSTPFRYPPLRHGSRFGRRHETGLWYGSETRRAAAAEVAYYRLVFLEGTAADLGMVSAQLSGFRARVGTERGVDLLAPPFDAHHDAVASPTDYGASQALGNAMRDAGVAALRYPSARDPRGGANVGIFDPAAFASPRPQGFETWHCSATRARVELRKQDYLRESAFTFVREVFLVEGVLPEPAP